MGTRAEFYLKQNGKYTFIGSIGWDGYPSGLSEFAKVNDLNSFNKKFSELLKRDDFSSSRCFPWNNPSGSDYTYVFNVDTDELLASNYGSRFVDFNFLLESEELTRDFLDHKDLYETIKVIGMKFDIPDQKVNEAEIFGKGSGLIILR